MVIKSDSPVRIDVLALGGTIAMTPDGVGLGVTPQLSAADLVAAAVGIGRSADIRAETVLNVPGASLGFDDLVNVLRVAEASVLDGAQGIVVTQGTDSMEETAWALDLMWDRAEPLVITGAMRPASALGADGPANLIAAATVAASDDARQRGVLVVLSDEIHAARFVVKVHSTRPAAFSSVGQGAVGTMTEGRPIFNRPSGGRHPGMIPRERDAPEVAIISAVLGGTGREVSAVGSAGFDGVVVSAMGGGHVPRALVSPLRELAKRMPVAVASRTGAGDLLRATYSFEGSEADLRGAGLLDSNSLPPLKARALLAMALWSTEDREGAEEVFRSRAARAY